MASSLRRQQEKQPQATLDYARVVHGTPALVLVLGTHPDFAILDASDAYLRATGTQRARIVGRPLVEVFADDPAEAPSPPLAHLRTSLETVVRTRTTHAMAVQKCTIQRPADDDGGYEERYWSPVNAPVIGEDGDVLCIVHCIEDVTELVRTTAALAAHSDSMRSEVLARSRALEEANRLLRQAHEQFQTIYEQGLFAARLRLDGSVIDVNHACIEVCGFVREEVIDKPFWDCGWWNRSVEVQRWVKHAVMTAVDGIPFRGESRYFWADGSEHVVDFACMPIRDASGHVILVVPTGMDITERVQAEENRRAVEEARRRAETLAELDRSKTTFFSNVSHEFRTPLALMLGPTEELLAATADGDSALPLSSARDQLELLHRNELRLLKLVNTLLEFSRVEAGRADAVYGPVDLAAYSAELASTFRSAVERTGVRLTIDTPALPEPVYIDREMWETVVLNLLSNAFKHTFEGEIAVAVRAGDGQAELIVRDTGVGIPADELPRVFERFHRVPSSRSRTHEGTGIGLALVQELVHLHSGRVDVVSEEGRGTVFTVRIPFGSAHLPKGRVGGTRERASTAVGAEIYVEEALRWSVDGQPDTARVAALEELPVGEGRAATEAGRVLVADDNADMREYVARLLRTRGWRVETARDGRAALTAVRRELPDLLLADVMMPGVDGFDLLRAVRTDPRSRELPIILLSARAGEEARIEGLDAGADDYVVKPFSARELVARVAAAIQLARVRRAAEDARHGSEARLRALVMASSDMIYRMNPDWSEMRRLDGRDSIADTDEPTQSWVEQYIHPEDRPRVTQAIADAIRTGMVFELEHRVLRVDGTVGWTFSRAVPLRNTEGQIVEWIGMASDVTGRKLTERALIEQSVQAETANQAKSEFLAAMSHELRTPLNAIAGYAQLIEMGVHGPVTDAQRRALNRIQRSEEHLRGLVSDVLDFAKLEAGRVEYVVEVVRLDEVVGEALTMVGPQLADRPLTVSVNVAPGVVARADHEKVRQVVLNLLSNAIKFTPPGGKLDISATTGASDGSGSDVAALRVADTGAGIPTDKLRAIFEPFVQVHRDRARTIGGTGLGLTISRNLARAMDGDLTVESVVGAGSTFTLTLPAASPRPTLAGPVA